MQWRMVARPENELLTCAAGASSIDASAQIVFTLPKASFMFFRTKIVGVTTKMHNTMSAWKKQNR